MALDLDDLVICGVCHQLRDRDPRRPAGSDGRVWCDCQRDQRPSGEAGIDAFELCYCCVAVLLRSAPSGPASSARTATPGRWPSTNQSAAAWCRLAGTR